MAEKPFSDFPSLISMQKRNGITFMSGKDDRSSCAQFVRFIAMAVKDDIKRILSAVNFFSGEMDGSEARKTKEEKELVFCKTVIRGTPTELLLKCQRMSEFSGVDAQGIKDAFEDAFVNEYNIPMEKFENLLVSICADGASVNMGKISGACTQMKATRPWLLIIHCINHRLELACANAFQSDPMFKQLADMMANIYYLFRNSGKNKRIIKRLAQRLSVTFCSFVNTKGTRFQAHHYRGIKVMIINYLCLLLFAENMINGPNKYCRPDLKAQLKGYHNKWVTYGYLASLELFRKILRLTTNTSITFQNQHLLITDVFDVLTECRDGLLTIASAAEPEFPFSIQIQDEEGKFTVTSTNLPATTQFRERSSMTARQIQQADKHITQVRESFEVKNVNQGKANVQTVKQSLIPKLLTCIDDRFKTLQEPVIDAMRIADHSSWDCDDSSFGKNYVQILADHFSNPLAQHKFNVDMALKELSAIKTLKATRFKGYKGKISFWEKMFADYHQKFPHFLLLIELCLTMALSSSTVERGFSTVKRHLSDSRLSLKNTTLNDLLIIRINVPALQKLDPDYEKKAIQKAVTMYMNDSSLQRGRYNKTTTQHSGNVSESSVNASKTDLFLPQSASMYIEANRCHSELLDSDIDISDQESGDESQSSLSDSESGSEELC